MFVAAFTFGDATLIVVELPFMFLWIWISIGVVFDIFRSRDLSNWSKALRVMAIFILRFWASWATSSSEAIHAMSSGRDRNRYEAFRRFSQHPPSTDAPGQGLHTLMDLRDRRLLTSEEFDRAKSRTLR
jgi:hypothetical protein